MSIDVEKEKQRLAQHQFLDWIKQGIRPSEMLTVYCSRNTEYDNIAIYCALIPNDRIEEILSDTSWDLAYGEGVPGTVICYQNGGMYEDYLRFGDDSGVEPLILCRCFNGMKPDYTEINEEFRLFHNLYHDPNANQYIKVDNAGNGHIVAVVEPDRIKVRLNEIKQFLAIRKMHLSVFFDCTVHSEATLQELDLKKGLALQKSESLLAYSLSYGNEDRVGTKSSYSRLLGKRLIPPFSKESNEFWATATDEPGKYVDFIIDVDEEGKNVLHTCNPESLADFFGKNPDNPDYLTRVFFRREVLDKYYNQPGKYTVEDGYLRCGDLWGIRIDNHHDDKVIVYLGDLGRDLPYEEQFYWRSYNIQPCGEISETTFRRSFCAEFADSDRPEHIFLQRYRTLQETSVKTLGWPILRPLDEGDKHYLKAIRIPSSDEQKDFDDLVLALAKVLIDSLNEKALNTLIPNDERGGIIGSISRLEKACEVNGVKGYETHIKFFRDLQDLRSTGSAHLKGSKYLKIAEKLGINNQSLRAVFQGILEKSIKVLLFLDRIVQRGCFQPDKEPAGGA